MAIEVPIGLLDSVGFACDLAARKLLKGKASSVFAPPARYMLDAAGDYAAIRALVELQRVRERDVAAPPGRRTELRLRVRETRRTRSRDGARLAALSTAVVCARGEQHELGAGQRDSANLPMRMAL